MDKRIIINADDFGLCEGVNKAVVQAHENGVLSSATIMANMPASADAVEAAKKMPDLGVGVHLNLFEGRALSKETCVEQLVDGEGRFAFSPTKLSLFSVAGHKIRNAVRAELAAQIQWVLDNGLKPTHLDSHKHIHCFPAMFPLVCNLARRFGIGAVRWCFEPRALSSAPWPMSGESARRKAGLIRAMAWINRIQDAELLKTDALLGVTHIGKIDVNFFRIIALYNTAATTEVMTHPGLADDSQPNETALVQQRKTELQALCDERTRQYLKDAGIKLVHYGQL